METSMKLGDAVKKVTEKLGIEQCEPCKERQEKLNNFSDWLRDTFGAQSAFPPAHPTQDPETPAVGDDDEPGRSLLVEGEQERPEAAVHEDSLLGVRSETTNSTSCVPQAHVEAPMSDLAGYRRMNGQMMVEVLQQEQQQRQDAENLRRRDREQRAQSFAQVALAQGTRYEDMTPNQRHLAEVHASALRNRGANSRRGGFSIDPSARESYNKR